MADTPELGRLERFALRYLERAYGRVPARVDDAVHVLDTEERAQLRRIELGVVFRAGLIGAFTAAIGALVEIEASAILGDDPDAASFDQQLLFWAIVGPTVGVTAVLEIALLYWDGLRSVHRLAVAAGLPLFGDKDEPRTTALALARAALELPNPRTAKGIDAHREASKLWLASVGLLYKAKVGLTAFLAKALIRRAAGRSLLRAWLVWVAVPVTAFWDAVVAWRVIREARLRALGPSAATELAEALFPRDGSRDALTEDARVAAHMAVGGSIVSTHDQHPNLLALLDAIDRGLGHVPEGVPLDDTRLFRERFVALTEAERDRVLEVLMVASVMDGRISRGERKLVQELQTLAGRSGLAGLHALRRRFVRGEPLTRDDVTNALGARR
ncbi:MAG: hypothetical protein H6724_19240 [Sandaracinus sp.]|nr:hypothetical protein [Sandaracinus sp.]